MTSFSIVYDSFFERVSDDMYLEMTELDTIRDLQGILLNAIPRFEFPRFDIEDYEEGYYDDDQVYKGVYSQGKEVPAAFWNGGYFNADLTKEEINILALCMVIEWIGRQIETTELAKIKYSGSDFKFSSQANHLSKLTSVLETRKQDNHHMQRLYGRRKRIPGEGVRSTMGSIVSAPDYGVEEYHGVSAFWSSNDY